MAPIDEEAFTAFSGFTEEERQRLHELHKNDPKPPTSRGGYRYTPEGIVGYGADGVERLIPRRGAGSGPVAGDGSPVQSADDRPDPGADESR